jgi:hypothetical protein
VIHPAAPFRTAQVLGQTLDFYDPTIEGHYTADPQHNAARRTGGQVDNFNWPGSAVRSGWKLDSQYAEMNVSESSGAI